MYYTASPSAHSWISAKVYGEPYSPYSQTVSSAWSDNSPDPSVFPSQSGTRHPNAPLIASVPLPGNLNSPFLVHPAGSSAPSLHAVLVYDRDGRLLFNLMHPFVNLRFRPCFPTTVMNESALTQRSARLCLTVPGIPIWTLEVSNPAGITVGDVVTKIHSFFHLLVAKEEFVTYPAQIQANSAAAFSQRTMQDPVQRAQGMKRLDLVYPNVYVIGLTRARDGSDRWDIQLAPSVRD